MKRNLEQYFGKWLQVIDKKKLETIFDYFKSHPEIIKVLCPSISNIFRAFELCPYDNCKAVFLGQDPYPQKGVATGVLFGNSKETIGISPSLKIIKDCVIDFHIPHNIINFDNTLESWCEQGILMINSALTCEMNNIGSHTNLWRPFVSTLLKNLSNREQNKVYVLFGKQAQTFKPYISNALNDIVEIEHPAYFARNNKEMPRYPFDIIERKYKDLYNEQIIWFKEDYYEEEKDYF